MLADREAAGVKRQLTKLVSLLPTFSKPRTGDDLGNMYLGASTVNPAFNSDEFEKPSKYRIVAKTLKTHS